MRALPLSALLLFAFLPACRQAPVSVVPLLHVKERVALSCEGSYERQGFQDLDEASAPLKEPIGIRAELAFASFTRGEFAMLRESGHLTCAKVSRQEAESMWAHSTPLYGITRSTLDLCADGPTYAAYESDTSFITGFRLVSNETAALLDPIVESMRSGLRLKIAPHRNDSPSLEPAPAPFRFEIEQLVLQLPVEVSEAPALVGGQSVHFHTPIFRRVNLATETTLQFDEALVVMGPSAEAGDRAFLATLTILPVQGAPKTTGVARAD